MYSILKELWKYCRSPSFTYKCTSLFQHRFHLVLGSLWKYHYGNIICIEIKITKAIHDKQKPKMQNNSFIKIIKRYQYTNCANCINWTNFNDFNKVTILHRWFLLILYGFWLFLFLCKLHSHYDIFNPFFVYFNAFHR